MHSRAWCAMQPRWLVCDRRPLMFMCQVDRDKMENQSSRTYFRVIVRTANGVLHLFVDLAMNCVLQQQQQRHLPRMAAAVPAGLPDLVLQPNLPQELNQPPYLVIAGGLLRNAADELDREHAVERWRFPLWFSLQGHLPLTISSVVSFLARLLRWR